MTLSEFVKNITMGSEMWLCKTRSYSTPILAYLRSDRGESVAWYSLVNSAAFKQIQNNIKKVRVEWPEDSEFYYEVFKFKKNENN